MNPTTHVAPGAPPTGDPALGAWLADHLEELIAFRRDLHAHPELSGDEHRTTAAVVDRLAAAGLDARRLSVGTGAICDAITAAPGRPTVALRADLDALAMHDETDSAFCSTVPGVSHACGHDVHTTVVLGAGLYFAEHPEQLPGGLRLIFQPSEERVPGGALDVLRDGGVDGVSSIVGVHCEPKLDVGRIAVRAGSISSAADMLQVTVSGPGGHTARPELTVDTIQAIGRLVTGLPDAVNAAIADGVPLVPDLSGEPSVKLVFGAVHGGDASNVIPTECVARASVRTPHLDVWDALEDVVRASITELLAPTGAEIRIDYTRGVPPVVNDAHVTEVVRTAAVDEFGAEAVGTAGRSWGGDDFAWFTREVPGTYVRLGVHDTDAGGPMLDLHAGTFDVDERAIGYGIRTLVAAARRLADA